MGRETVGEAIVCDRSPNRFLARPQMVRPNKCWWLSAEQNFKINSQQFQAARGSFGLTPTNVGARSRDAWEFVSLNTGDG